MPGRPPVAVQKKAGAILRGAISTFYDIRESGAQFRGEYAGHFFMVDAVGLDNTDRPVPWEVLRGRVGDERLTQLSAIFDEAVLQAVRDFTLHCEGRSPTCNIERRGGEAPPRLERGSREG